MATTLAAEMASHNPAYTMSPSDQPHEQEIPGMVSANDFQPDLASHDAPFPSPRNMPMNPLPPFVFPAKPTTSSAPSSFSRATGRRPRSSIETQNRPFSGDNGDSAAERSSRSPALPSFSFNPGASVPSDLTSPMLSPPMSPQSPQRVPSPSRNGHGHRRGGSEFVGGTIRGGDSITVMSSSPTKSESGFASPSFQLPEQPAGQPRRGQHRHRRSAAISSHDLTLILQPPKTNSNTRGSSAPTSPADFGSPGLPDSLDHKMESQSLPPTPQSALDQFEVLAGADQTPVPPPKTVTPRASKSAPRARVGFSDTLEFIPRPLSLVSSDASSTATARPGGHSVSGSLSSIISLGSGELERTKLDQEFKPAVSEAPTIIPQGHNSRPSTAGAILERSDSTHSVQHDDGNLRRRNSNPTLTSSTDTTADGTTLTISSKTSKRWSFFSLEPFSTPQAPSRPSQKSTDSTESLSNADDSASTLSAQISDSAPEDTSHEKHKTKKDEKKKRKKKVKTWAGSLLKAKTKTRAPDASPEADVSQGERQRIPSDNSSVSEDVQPDVGTVSLPPTVMITDSSGSPHSVRSWKTRPAPSMDEDTSVSMIDLDAALGPFNTPLPHNAEWEAAQQAAGTGFNPSKRQLYSAQGMRGFSGPGMHYHRRAESAPEMVPFEAKRLGITRFGSSSTMADVFEEEEEDGNDADTTASSSRGKTTSTDPLPQTAASSDGEVTPPAVPGLNPLEAQPLEDVYNEPRLAASMRSERSINSLQEQVIVEEHNGVEFRTASLFQDPADVLVCSKPLSRRASGNRDLTPVEVGPLHLSSSTGLPLSPYSISPVSSFPSPRSPMSYDTHRISTAPSSVSEENTFQSLLLGEPGPEVRFSVDIPPSLTSSTSTMTRDSAFIPGAQPRPRKPNRTDERPVSVSSTAFGRRRSSLASLSRLISSSHGERSKLSMEVSYETEHDKKQKASKSKRLSRMMQFWKPSKESPEA